MPEPGENEDKDKFISRCIPMVMEEGTAKDNEQAFAMCNSMWEQHEKKQTEKTMLDMKAIINALKVGARHSQRDARALQDIHDAAITLGAMCPPPVEDTTSFNLADEMAGEKTTISYGGEIKSLGDGKLGGYLVRFSSELDPDLEDDFFAKDTDFDMDFPGLATVYFNHGVDPKIKQRKLGKAKLKLDEFGIWAETILQERDEYEKFLINLAKEGKLGWSSGTASHLIERESVGKAFKITRWPLGLDASLTHTPAEPRNTVIPLKSFMSDLQVQTDKPKETVETEQYSVPASKDKTETAQLIRINIIGVQDGTDRGQVSRTDDVRS